MKTFRNPPTIHPPLAAYSHQVEVTGPERWLVLAGQVGRRPDGTVPEDPVEQLRVALDNITRNLEAAGMGVRDLVRVTYYLVGPMDLARRREVTAAWLGGHKPAATMLYVAGLATPEYKVEVDAWASRPEAQ